MSDRIREVNERFDVISTEWGIHGKPLAGVEHTGGTEIHTTCLVSPVGVATPHPSRTST